MPTYEYTCKTCGANLEMFQKFTDKPLKTCAHCGGELQKVFHASGVVFKGSGFYATDSRASASSAGSDNGSSKGESKKAEPKKSEKKTEAPSPAKSG